MTDIEDASVDEDYLSKSPVSGRIGKAAELLVAAVCILATAGELNASASFVDDEGVDLVLHRRGSSAMLAVQIKCRTSAAQLVRRGRFAAQVRSQTLRARDDLDMLFVVVDADLGAITTAWLVPSPQFQAAASRTAAALPRLDQAGLERSVVAVSGHRPAVARPRPETPRADRPGPLSRMRVRTCSA